ncbi:MAG TPA: hypothetical protein VEX86_27600 [Longimicrobium sp.]|nr:hypothetical protein [Longimicrobium sp.]
MPRAVLLAAVAVFAAAVPAAAQQGDPYPGAIIYPGQMIPAGYHAHPHGNHGHLHRGPDAQQPQPAANQLNAAQREYMRQVMISQWRQQITHAQESYRQCSDLRGGTTSSVYRSSMNCEQWLAMVQRLQAQIAQVQAQR